jgi:hypothetical protein
MPPDKPPTPRQIAQRKRWATAMQNWNTLTVSQKKAWNEVTLKLSIAMTGTSIWMKISLLGLQSTVDTLIRQSGIHVVTPPYVP